MKVRIRLFGTIPKQNFDRLFETLKTKNEFNEWYKEYFDDNFQLSTSRPIYFTDYDDPSSFFRSTYEIIDIGKLHNEGFSPLTQIDYADLFVQKSISICFQAIAVFKRLTIPLHDMLKFLSDSEQALASSIMNFGFTVHSSVHALFDDEQAYIDQSGIEAFNTLILPIKNKIKTASQLNYETFITHVITNSGADRYILFSRKEVDERFDELTPYYLLLSKHALNSLKIDYLNLINKLESLRPKIDEVSASKSNNSMIINRLGGLRNELIRIKKSHGNTQAMREIVSLFISENLMFLKTASEHGSPLENQKELLMYESKMFFSFFERPIGILSKRAENLVNQLENQVMSLMELTSLKINLRVQSLLKWLQILGFIVAILSAVFAGYQITEKFFPVTTIN